MVKVVIIFNSISFILKVDTTLSAQLLNYTHKAFINNVLKIKMPPLEVAFYQYINK